MDSAATALTAGYVSSPAASWSLASPIGSMAAAGLASISDMPAFLIGLDPHLAAFQQCSSGVSNAWMWTALLTAGSMVSTKAHQGGFDWAPQMAASGMQSPSVVEPWPSWLWRRCVAQMPASAACQPAACCLLPHAARSLQGWRLVAAAASGWRCAVSRAAAACPEPAAACEPAARHLVTAPSQSVQLPA